MTFQSAKPTEAHKAIIAQLLAEDVELREMARQFVVLGMRETIHQLTRGDAATRAAIARSLASTLTKAITETGEDDSGATLRAEMQQMMAEMRGEWMDEVADGREAEDDSAPPRVMVAKKPRAT